MKPGGLACYISIFISQSYHTFSFGNDINQFKGIVSEKNYDGTFNLVKLEQSILIKDVKEDQFQSYHVYHEGFQALYEVNREEYVQVTIVQFLPGSARPGFELHGKYQFTYDDDENDPKTIREAPSMRMHRYAGVGEIIGTGSNRDHAMNEV